MEYLKGKGAQINTSSRFLLHQLDTKDLDGLDELLIEKRPVTQVLYETPKKIISTNNSPDIPFVYSVNPYQGCEHGCVYCYARTTHEYWGMSAGLDFETKIIVKKEAPELLERTFLRKGYKPKVIMLSGNTDCYQPLEKRFKLSRQLLELCLKYRHPISIITKNALIKRDLDILSELASENLAQVIFSITTEDEELRQKLEPRTASAAKKFTTMKLLSKAGVPVSVMMAPIIPSLNHHEIPSILKRSSENGAMFANYTVVRLNGQIGEIFKDWLVKNFPDRQQKVWNQIQALHKGQVEDSTFGRRMSGDGETSAIIRQLFKINRKKFFKESASVELDLSKFRRGGNYTLF